MTNPDEPAKVLTIAGSDSGGAAGLQADLKTFAALGIYGMSAITIVTAQNSASVQAAHGLPPRLVVQQIEAVLEDYGAAAIKTGLIGDPELVAAVAGCLRAYGAGRDFHLIVDPVLVNHRGESLFDPGVAQAYRDHLLPLCTLLTPNCAEAALLTGQAVSSLSQARTAARTLRQLDAANVLLTGWAEGAEMVDLFCNGQGLTELRTARLDTINTHGSGDTLSAAIAAFLAQGAPLPQAIHQARAFTNAAIKGARGWRLGAGHGPLNYWDEWRAETGD